MNGASRPPKRDAMLELPIARWRTGVGKSSVGYTYATPNVSFIVALPNVVNIVTKYARSEMQAEVVVNRELHCKLIAQHIRHAVTNYGCLRSQSPCKRLYIYALATCTCYKYCYVLEDCA